MTTTATACAACHHDVDSAAKICPYCGSDPHTGQKIVDSTAMLQEMFHPRRLSTSESLLEYARHRQGIVIAICAIVALVLLAALHQFVTMRNQNAVSAAPAVPLSDIADVSTPPDATKPAPMPDLNFQYDGNAEAMRTFIVEPGAVAPQQPQAAQAQPQPAKPATPQTPAQQTAATPAPTSTQR